MTRALKRDYAQREARIKMETKRIEAKARLSVDGVEKIEKYQLPVRGR